MQLRSTYLDLNAASHYPKIREVIAENIVMNAEAQDGPNIIGLAGDIVAAYVSNNPVPTSELPALIASVHAAIYGLGTGAAVAPAAVEVEKPTPAQIRKSIRQDGIVSFIDGKSYKTLKRHLTGHGLDPHSYRQRYSLPADYPMIAQSYAEQRSALAKSIGLGRVGSQAERHERAKKAT